MSVPGDLIEKFKAEALSQYGKSVLQWFVEWRERGEQEHKETIAKLEQGFEITKKEIKGEASRVIDSQKCELEKLEKKLSG